MKLLPRNALKLPGRLTARVRLDRVWVAIAIILLALTVIDAPQLARTLLFVAAAVGNTFGFLLLSVGLTAFAKASGADNLISRAFSGPPLLAVVLAALMGAVSPFCSCGVIPIIVALLAMGVPLAPVMAFWLASPLMDPSMFAKHSPDERLPNPLHLGQYQKPIPLLPLRIYKTNKPQMVHCLDVYHPTSPQQVYR